jgi:hypothetical protein
VLSAAAWTATMRRWLRCVRPSAIDATARLQRATGNT